MGNNPFSYASQQRNQRRLDLLLNFQHEGTLLDLGCGTGGFLAVANTYFEVEGIDRQPLFPQPSGPDSASRMIEADINTVELEPGRYDVVTMFNLLEHLRDPYRIIQEAHTGLKPGGILFGSVPNNRWFAGKIHTLVSNFFDRSHCSTFHPAKWRAYFQHAGFQSTWLFGEILLGRLGFFCTSPIIWEGFSFNLMFLGRKGKGEVPRVDPPADRARLRRK
jgi:2-polyprenyl-3-methyl-5-hydroxy-6-metoxy-1,4-benzoquinol methylase